MTEWYVHGPLGLEQGFTVQRPPVVGDTVRLDVEFASDSYRLHQRAGGVALVSSEGCSLRMTDTFAYDDDGRALSVSVKVTPAGYALVVDVRGASWPIVIDPLFSEEQQLEASDAAVGDGFGRSVAVDGDTAIVGAPGAFSSSNAGMAYIFVRNGTAWTEQEKLEASDAAASDLLGWSVDLDGDTAVIGAYRDDTVAGSDAGSAYVFTRNGTTWTEEQKLEASDAVAGSFFGGAVRIDGDTVVVGSHLHDTLAGTRAGSAYVFVRSGTTWTEEQILEASDAATNDFFGRSVALDGDTIVVGASGDDTSAGASAGSAYVFTRSGTTWTERQKLEASDAGIDDQFGNRVALDGDRTAVGALRDNTASGGIDAGSVYVFVRGGSTWTEEQKLEASDATDSAFFGNSVALDGDTIVIGSDNNVGAVVNAGSAYIFTRSGTAWTQQQKLQASIGGVNASFGWSVALAGDTIAVGVVGDDTSAGVDAGSAYVFAIPPPPPVGEVEAGSTGGEAPGPEPAFEQTSAVSGSGDDVVFVGGSGSGRQGVYRDSGGQTVVVADASTSVPEGTGTFDSPFIDVDVESSTVALSSELGVYASEGGPLFRVADASTSIPSGGGSTFDTFGEVEVTDGDIVFQGGSGGAVTGIYRDENRVLSRVVDTTTSLPGGRTATTFDELESSEGELAFSVDSATGPAVYKESSGAFTLIADSATTVPGTAETFDDFEEIAISMGDVAFVGTSATQVGIFENSAGTVSTIVDGDDSIPTSPAETFGAFDLAGYLDNGEVAFVGLDDSDNTEGIFRGSPTTTVQTMFDASQVLPNGQGPLTRISETAVTGDQVIFVAVDAQDSYLGTFTVSVGSAASVKPLPEIPGGNVFLSLGRPLLSGSRVVFLGKTSAYDGLYTSTLGAVPELLVDTQAAFSGLPQFAEFPDYAATGSDVAFVALDEDAEYGIYRGATSLSLSSVVTPGGSLPGMQTLGTGGAPKLQADGDNVVFSNVSSGIYLNDGTTTTTIADTSTPDPDGTGTLGADFGNAHVENGAYVFMAEDTSGSPGIYRSVAGSIQLIANDTVEDPEQPGSNLDGFNVATTSIVMTASDVVFAVDDANAEPAIYLWNGGTLQMLVDASTPIDGTPRTIQDLSTTSFDYDNARLVFTAEDDNGTNGVFLLSGGQVAVLLSAGDAVPDGDATYVSFSGISIDGNMVAVSAEDSDGTLDIYTLDLAPPPPAPGVPALPFAAAVLLALGLAGLTFIFRPTFKRSGA